MTCSCALSEAKRKRISNNNESHLMNGKKSFKKASIGATLTEKQQQKNGGTRRKAECKGRDRREARG